jgi:hypothetical protein
MAGMNKTAPTEGIGCILDAGQDANMEIPARPHEDALFSTICLKTVAFWVALKLFTRYPSKRACARLAETQIFCFMTYFDVQRFDHCP